MSQLKQLAAMVVVLFSLTACGGKDNNSAVIGGPTTTEPSSSESWTYVDIPDDLVTDTVATIVVYGVKKGTIGITAPGYEETVRSFQFETATKTWPYQGWTENVISLDPDRGYLVVVIGDDFAGKKVFLYQSFRTKSAPQILAPPKPSPTVSSARLDIVCHGPAADQSVVVGSTNLTVLTCSLSAIGDAVRLTSIGLSMTGNLTGDDFRNIRVMLDGDPTPVASESDVAGSNHSTEEGMVLVTPAGRDNLLPSPIMPGRPGAIIHVVVDIGSAGMATLGDSFLILVNNAGTTGRDGNGNPVSVTATTSACYSTIVPFSVTVIGDYPIGNVAEAVVPGTYLGRVKVTNNGTAPVDIGSLRFVDSGSHASATDISYRLWYSDENSEDYVTYSAGAAAINRPDFPSFPDPVRLDAGAYRYFMVTAGWPFAAAFGDTWQLSVPVYGIGWSVSEYDLGYDGSMNGHLGDIIGFSTTDTVNLAKIMDP